jgi:hypothetical protein
MASLYDEDRELLSGVPVDLVEESSGAGQTWGGTFKLDPPRKTIEVGASYTLKLEDGRAGTIRIVDFDESAAMVAPWVAFRGSGTLG